MLPKVATHFLQHTSRVAAAVQNQTSQAIRNAFQQVNPSGSTNGSTSLTQYGGVGGSGWGGSSSAGPGGAKFNAGSRYQGYNGAGRSVTQANTSSAQADEEETTVHTVRPKSDEFIPRPRPRSNSLSLSTRERIVRQDGLGVLKVLQLRAKQAFAAYNSSGKELPANGQSLVLVRTNTTAAQVVSDTPPPPLPAPEPVKAVEDRRELDSISAFEAQLQQRLQSAVEAGDMARLASEIEQFRAQERASVRCYNSIFRALSNSRVVGQPITLILELYNEMVQKRGILPDTHTYQVMILTLCSRDNEVHRVIQSLETRIAKQKFISPSDPRRSVPDEKRLQQLRKEDNFTSALRLFDAATIIRSRSLGLSVYNGLLRACAIHNDVDTALRVFAHLERFPDERPSTNTFLHLLSVFCNVGDLRGAERVFQAYRNAAARGSIAYGTLGSEQTTLHRKHQILLWNKMIETYFKCGEPALAVELVEAMLSTPLGPAFKMADPPLPNALTYTGIITGFCKSGDLDSALKWFDQLVQQQETAPDPYIPLPAPPRPEQQCWQVMLMALAEAGQTQDLNRLWKVFRELKEESGDTFRMADRNLVLRANLNVIENPDTDRATKDACIRYVKDHILDIDAADLGLNMNVLAARETIREVTEGLWDQGETEESISVLERFIVAERKALAEEEASGSLAPDDVLFRLKGLRNIFMDFRRHINDFESKNLTLKQALRIVQIGYHIDVFPSQEFALAFARLYTHSKNSEEPLQLTQAEYDILVRPFIVLEMPPLDAHEGETAVIDVSENPGLASVLTDLGASDFDPMSMDTMFQRRMLRALIYTHGQEKTKDIIRGLGPKFEPLLRVPGLTEESIKARIPESLPSDAVKSELASAITVDLFHTRFVNEWFPTNPKVSLKMAYERYASGVARKIYPSPECLARMLAGFGRLGDFEKLYELYNAAQLVIASLDRQKRWQNTAWFVVEDHMIIGLAHGGDHAAADMHRARIIEAGGAPSADAYGALISSVKDTTDDAAYALQYWEDALYRGVRPHVFMYNTIISKLSKARKADLAISIFRQMVENGVQPTAVTYGAIIAAACRVGDTNTAEMFFAEMARLPNYKPRAAPYNTMMQLYIYTKPDRERALEYYHALIRDHVAPTEHTYRLLLELYGKTDPVDLQAMQQVFDTIAADPRIEVQGSHWATLVSVYGCTAQDLDRAIGVFESIATHPSTARSKTKLPDAIVYEALFNVLAFHHRQDLIPSYIRRLEDTNVRSTAYVSNAIIRGYAAAGDIASAREVFEAMEDPPMGKAAPFNRPARSQGSPESPTDTRAPIYREPSTWEAMVRAELGVGEHERANELIRRMESRLYPELVVQRVRDILQAPSINGITSSPSLSHGESPSS